LRLQVALAVPEDEAEARRNSLYKQLSDNEETLTDGDWYLDWIEQTYREKGKPKHHRLSVRRDRDGPIDGSVVWRIVRGLERGPVTIGLRRHGHRETVELSGWRRVYTDPTSGVINGAYQPGELMQGLCSPWQHDFRDCQCFYWAANHPDVVLGELYPGESLPPDDGPRDPVPGDGEKVGEKVIANVPLDWIRADRSRALAAAALGTIAENRPYQLDAFEINTAWQDLSMVLEGREISGLYLPQTIESANPFATPAELVSELRNKLAPLELALTFEYLYAYFSLRDGADAERQGDQKLAGAVNLVRQRLMLIATSEMQHLRWVNQILWHLWQLHLRQLPPKKAPFEPVLEPADEIPRGEPEIAGERVALPGAKKTKEQIAKRRGAVQTFVTTMQAASSGTNKTRKVKLRSLTREAMNDFIAVEHPSNFIDGKYARVVATLRQPGYPPNLADLAMRIVGDGAQHEIQFREIKDALAPFDPHDPNALPQFLRKIEVADTEVALRQAEPAREQLKIIKTGLKHAYKLAGNNEIQDSGKFVGDARKAMSELHDVGEKLAKRGIGIPFFKFWKDAE
jgi:hypothetical protein